MEQGIEGGRVVSRRFNSPLRSFDILGLDLGFLELQVKIGVLPRIVLARPRPTTWTAEPKWVLSPETDWPVSEEKSSEAVFVVHVEDEHRGGVAMDSTRPAGCG